MLSDKFILGIMAGEGSFHIVLESPTRQRPKFKMTMYEGDILRQMCLQLGLGSVSHDWGDRYSWHIQSKQDVRDLRNWISNNMCEGFKSTDKFRQFELWSEAVDIIPDDRRPISKNDREQLVELSYEIPKSDTKGKDKSEWLQAVRSVDIYYCGAEKRNGGECGNRVPTENFKCRHHE